MSLLVISDLHIWGPDDPLYSCLLALIRDRAQPGDIVVLAGDLFDLFVGNKEVFTQSYSEFFNSLRQATQRGIQCHYIEGNHDFLLAKAFASLPQVQIHSQDVGIELDRKKFYIAHGDKVDRTDYGYRFLRAFLRSPVMRAFVFCMPGKVIQKIGEKSSYKSRNSKPTLFAELPMARMEFLRRTYRSFAAERLAQGFDYVVLGHCHDLDEMSFKIGGRMGQYINVGFPRSHGSFLSWSAGDDKIQREKLPD